MEEPAGEPEASGNSTSEEEGWLGAGRKSSKSVASSSFSNSVLGGAEKDSLGLLENDLLKGGQEKRRRRSTVGHEENEEGMSETKRALLISTTLRRDRRIMML